LLFPLSLLFPPLSFLSTGFLSFEESPFPSFSPLFSCPGESTGFLALSLASFSFSLLSFNASLPISLASLGDLSFLFFPDFPSSSESESESVDDEDDSLLFLLAEF